PRVGLWPPIFVLRGGPGYPGIDGELDSSNYYRFFIRPFLGTTDMIFVGQRGFGTSYDTPCEDREALSLADSFDDALREQANRAALDRCRAAWEATGLDLAGFNAIEAAADVADAARALGYDQIQLFASSYGSHIGMTVMRDHPDLVARATLNALEGPDHTYDDPDGLVRALKAVAASVEADSSLAPHLPDEGLLEAYQALIQRADTAPLVVDLEHPDTGDSIRVRLDGDDFRQLVLGVTSNLSVRFGMPAWPTDLLTILAGDYQAAAERILRANTRTRQRNAAFWQLDCGSGITATRRDRYLAAAGTALVGPAGQMYENACSVWASDLGDAFRTGFTSDIPVVLTHGTWDLSTPLENALELLPDFSVRHLVTIEGGSHIAVWEATEVDLNFEAALLHWLATGDTSQLPERVVLPPMRWQVPEE
ncbi:MAG: alpha/beta fold hydrolase, partial [Bacteroidota bacterium]